jgi:hypothetical protein
MKSKKREAIEVIGHIVVGDTEKTLKSFVGGKLVIRYEREEPCQKGDLIITDFDCHVLGEIIE